MNTIIVSFLLLAVISLFVSWIASRPRGAQFTPLANVAEGTHEDGIFTLTADNVFSEVYSLVKLGAAEGGADICGASDVPFGVAQEAPAAGESFAVEQLGKGRSKLMRVATGGVTFKDLLVPAAAGRVKPLPADPGTYKVVGVALQTRSTAGDTVEVADCTPYDVVVGS